MKIYEAYYFDGHKKFDIKQELIRKNIIKIGIGENLHKIFNTSTISRYFSYIFIKYYDKRIYEKKYYIMDYILLCEIDMNKNEENNYYLKHRITLDNAFYYTKEVKYNLRKEIQDNILKDEPIEKLIDLKKDINDEYMNGKLFLIYESNNNIYSNEYTVNNGLIEGTIYEKTKDSNIYKVIFAKYFSGKCMKNEITYILNEYLYRDNLDKVRLPDNNNKLVVHYRICDTKYKKIYNNVTDYCSFFPVYLLFNININNDNTCFLDKVLNISEEIIELCNIEKVIIFINESYNVENIIKAEKIELIYNKEVINNYYLFKTIEDMYINYDYNFNVIYIEDIYNFIEKINIEDFCQYVNSNRDSDLERKKNTSVWYIPKSYLKKMDVMEEYLLANNNIDNIDIYHNWLLNK